MLSLECAASKIYSVKTTQQSTHISLLISSNQKATLLFSKNAIVKYRHLYSFPSSRCSVKAMATKEAAAPQSSTNSRSPSSGMHLFLAFYLLSW